MMQLIEYSDIKLANEFLTIYKPKKIWKKKNGFIFYYDTDDRLEQSGLSQLSIEEIAYSKRSGQN